MLSADDNESYPAGLPPEDSLAQRFLQYFHHPWGFIYAPLPSPGDHPDWHTETRYPLQPRNLWSRYQDPGELLGLRFGNTTHYFMADIDAGSGYHPVHHLENFNHVLATLETVGLTRNFLIRSSDSGGIHVYFFFKEKLDSFYLAYAVFLALQQAGIVVKGGQLELFPNPKPYGLSKPTNFKAHRLPLQAGSYLLDDDLQPCSNDLVDFLDAAAWSTTGQDYESLHQAIAHAKTQSQQRFTKKHTSNAAQLWQANLEERIGQGWTGFHQTNELLKDISCYGIVFRGLQGEVLIDYVVATAEAAPGYRTWCRHQHEIRKRATERARNCEGYYTPYCSIPDRLRSYREQFGEVNNVVPFSPNQQRHEQTFARVSAAVTTLKEQGEFPSTTSARTKAIIEISKTLYGIGVSQTTLHKPPYLPLWHPLHEKEGVNAEVVQVVAPPPPEKYPQLPDPWLESPNPETLTTQAVASAPDAIYMLPPYMKVLCLPPAASPENQKSILKQQTTDKQNKSLSPKGALQDHNKPALSIAISVTQTRDVVDSRSDSKIDINPTTSQPNSSSNFTQVSIQVSTPDSLQTSNRSTPLSILSHHPEVADRAFRDLLNHVAVYPPPSPLLKDQEGSDGTGVTPDEHRHATRLRLQAILKARKWVKSYSSIYNLQLTPLERQEIEDLALRILLVQAGSLLLMWETREWFVLNFDRLIRRGWGWIGILLFPDLFG